MATISRRNFDLTTDQLAGGNARYDLKNFTYPPDLFRKADTFTDCWLMININVQDRTLKGNNQYKPVELNENEKKRRQPYGMQDVNPTTGAGTAAAIAVGTFALKDYLKGPKNYGGNTTKAALGRLTSAAGVGTGAALPFLMVKELGKRKAVRISTAIQLPMPNQITTNYSAQWGSENTVLMDLMARLGPQALGSNNQTNGTMARLEDPLANFVLATAQIAGSGSISAATGLAANPKKELIFDSVDFRTFSMNYKFYPKSREESIQLQNVINELKYHMHPSYLTEGKFTFVYPSEFDITFYAKDGKENTYINKIATCVLTNLVVNNTPDGLWAAHDEGAPNGIDIQMSFKELSLMTKESIDLGF